MKYISLVLLLVGMASAQHCRKIDINKSSGFCIVPDPKLTPGEMDASLACVSNSDRPRNVSNAKKNAILAAYEYPAGTKKSSGEFDHWLPHWMGRKRYGTTGCVSLSIPITKVSSLSASFG